MALKLALPAADTVHRVSEREASGTLPSPLPAPEPVPACSPRCRPETTVARLFPVGSLCVTGRRALAAPRRSNGKGCCGPAMFRRGSWRASVWGAVPSPPRAGPQAGPTVTGRAHAA